MFRVVSWDGETLADGESVTKLLRVMNEHPDAKELQTAEGVTLRFWTSRRRKTYEPMAAVGRDAGEPWLDRSMVS